MACSGMPRASTASPFCLAHPASASANTAPNATVAHRDARPIRRNVPGLSGAAKPSNRDRPRPGRSWRPAARPRTAEPMVRKADGLQCHKPRNQRGHPPSTSREPAKPIVRGTLASRRGRDALELHWSRWDGSTLAAAIYSPQAAGDRRCLLGARAYSEAPAIRLVRNYWHLVPRYTLERRLGGWSRAIDLNCDRVHRCTGGRTDAASEYVPVFLQNSAHKASAHRLRLSWSE